MNHSWQSIRSAVGLALSLILGTGGAARAETVVLRDGSTITGELVGFENGEYRIKIGRFVKVIPEGDIQDVRDGAGGSTADSAADDAGDSSDAAPVAASSEDPPPRPTSRTPARPVQPAAGGGDKVGDLQSILKQAMQDAGVTDSGNLVESQGMQDTLSSFTGGKGNMSPAELEELQKNPQVQEVVKQYADPEYQKGILSAIEDQWGDNPDSKGQVDTLKKLFDYLNQVKTK